MSKQNQVHCWYRVIFKLYVICSVWLSMCFLATILCIQQLPETMVLIGPAVSLCGFRQNTWTATTYYYIPVQPAQPETIANCEPVAVQPESGSDNELDDATIEEGDGCRRQISGAPQASMMCVENPENFRHSMWVAPAEGERPLNMTHLNFAAMSNPSGTLRRVLK